MQFGQIYLNSLLKQSLFCLAPPCHLFQLVQSENPVASEISKDVLGHRYAPTYDICYVCSFICCVHCVSCL